MKEAVRQRLEELRIDYANHVGHGQGFQHFFCPILYKDEDVEFIEAHIVNKSFPNISREWTVQRGDVDNFYGAYFESEFTKLQYSGTDVFDVIGEASLYKKLNPRLSYENQPIDIYLATGQIPSTHSPLILSDVDNLMFGVKMRPDEFQEKLDGNWAFEYKVDATLESMVSLIKAAHLTLFHLLGYRYARTSSSIFMGHDILGKFFKQNQNEPNKSKILNNAIGFFKEFEQLVRPVSSLGWESKGTLTDKIVLLCRNTSNNIWGMIVLIYIGGNIPLHAVLTPLIHDEDSAVTFGLFLQKRIKNLEVSRCRFEGDRWNSETTWYTINWVHANHTWPSK